MSNVLYTVPAGNTDFGVAEATTGSGCFRCSLEPPQDIEQEPDNGYHTKTFTCSGQEVRVFFRAARFDRQKYRRKIKQSN